MNSEPKCLRRGKEFHRSVQLDWLKTAEGEITREKSITKPNWRRGRIDIHVDADDGHVAVVEIKNSDWDAMKPTAVRRNVRRYSRQIFKYVDAELSEDVTVSIGIIFPKRPSSTERMELVEELFWDEGVPVVWEDESIDECRERNLKKRNRTSV